jgi:hypothetical protein
VEEDEVVRHEEESRGVAENAVPAVHIQVGGERWALAEKRNEDLMVVGRRDIGGGVVPNFAPIWA